MRPLFKLAIFACLLSIQGGALWAQAMPFSHLAHHNNISGSGIITRVLPLNWELTCSKSANSDGKHTFTFYSPSTGETKYFTRHLGTLFTSWQDDYFIKVLYIFNYTCFFCGYRNEVYEALYDPEGNIIEPGGVTSHGFVGYFKFFPSMAEGSGGAVIPDDPFNPPFPPSSFYPSVDSIYLIDIPNTDSITQIVAHHDSPTEYDMLIMAVAYNSLFSRPTSIVELTKPVGTADTYWKHSIVQPTCAEDGEYLTDILLTKEHVVAASKLPYADGELDGDTDPTHYQFRLHQTKRPGFYCTTIPPYSAPSVSIDTLKGTNEDCPWNAIVENEALLAKKSNP